MTKNKININRKELSSQQVGEQENLEGILSKHQNLTKRPAYKQKKYYFLLFLILLIAFLIYYTDKERGVEKPNNEPTKTEQTN